MLNNEEIARVAHEVNRAYCTALGDDSQVPWDKAPEWQRETCVNGVEFHLTNDKTPEESHQSWMDEKVAEGWVFGEVKDAEKKTHPCIVPYADLPLEQKIKDYLFSAVVATISKMQPHKEAIKVASVPFIPAEVGDGKVPIRYIGKRLHYVDGAYGTGIAWEKGETQLVPADKARLMLRHPDQYEVGEVEGAGEPIVDESVEDEVDETEETEDATRNSIRQMGRKADLVTFAKTNFNIDLDAGSKVKVADLQNECIRLVDQLGLPE